MPQPICCLCGGPMRFYGDNPENPFGWGNNPEPLSDGEYDRCCDECNWTKVIPARITGLQQPTNTEE